MTARKNANASSDFDFDTLLQTAEFEDRQQGVKNRYLDVSEVKPLVTQKVKEAHANRKRLPLRVVSKAHYDQVHAQFSSAAYHLGLTANVRSVYEGEGEDAKLVGVTITVTDKRVSKKSTAVPVDE